MRWRAAPSSPASTLPASARSEARIIGRMRPLPTRSPARKDLTPAAIAQGLRSFAGLSHRMEQVARLGKVLFVNDFQGDQCGCGR